MARFSLPARAATLGTALTLTALALAGTPSIATAAPARGVVTPAIGVSPHYRMIGSAKQKDVAFDCQATTPIECFGPDQLRHAYGVDALGKAGIDGRGTTIVIVDAYSAPAIRHDLDNFNTAFGLPSAKLNIIAPQGLTPFDQNDANQVGWSAEISLDVEWAHAIAPAATIDLVLAKSNDDRDLKNALDFVANKGLGDVVSQSYGEAEQCSTISLLAEHRTFAKMNAHGTTVLASSGDEGAAEPTCDGNSWLKSASTPASDPNVTGIGGTALYAAGTTGDYLGETVWNEPDYAAAGGSGFSKVFREPAFQRSVQHTGTRTVPDVSYSAAINESVLVAWSTSGMGSDLFFGFGGTSCGSPQWAGLVALATQKAHHRLGSINDELYAIGTRASGVFHDITKGDTSVVEPDVNGDPVSITGVPAHPGWDFATGFGSPKADLVVPLLAKVSGR